MLKKRGMKEKSFKFLRMVFIRLHEESSSLTGELNSNFNCSCKLQQKIKYLCPFHHYIYKIFCPRETGLNVPHVLGAGLKHKQHRELLSGVHSYYDPIDGKTIWYRNNVLSVSIMFDCALGLGNVDSYVT